MAQGVGACVGVSIHRKILTNVLTQMGRFQPAGLGGGWGGGDGGSSLEKFWMNVEAEELTVAQILPWFAYLTLIVNGVDLVTAMF